MVAPGDVVLRPLRADDERLYVGLYTDARAMRHVGPALAPDAARRGFALAVKQADDPAARLRLWVVASASGDGALGLVSLRRDPDGRGAELGIMLVRQAQARGAALAALRRAIVIGLVEWGFGTVWSRHHAANHAAARLMRQLAFEALGPDPGDGQLRYRMTRSDWAATAPALPDVAAAMFEG